MLPETEITRFNPRHYSTVYRASPRSFPLVVSRGKSPRGFGEFVGELTIAEFVTRYEVVEEKGRCFVKRVLYPLPM